MAKMKRFQFIRIGRITEWSPFEHNYTSQHPNALAAILLQVEEPFFVDANLDVLYKQSVYFIT